MGAAFFYHLTRSTVEATLPMLLDKSVAAGWRVVVRGAAPDRLEALDQSLWDGPPESFRAHGRASGGALDALQPILLTAGPEVPNGAHCLMSLDGAEVTPEEVQAMARTCILFDGMDEAALARARGQWASLTAAGCAAQYWSEESGKWEKKAEKAPAE